MEINFNNLRKQIASEYNNIVSQLNINKLPNTEWIGDGYGGSTCGDILMMKDDISPAINMLHDLIGALASCHNDTDVQDISEDITLLTLKQ